VLYLKRKKLKNTQKVHMCNHAENHWMVCFAMKYLYSVRTDVCWWWWWYTTLHSDIISLYPRNSILATYDNYNHSVMYSVVEIFCIENEWIVLKETFHISLSVLLQQIFPSTRICGKCGLVDCKLSCTTKASEFSLYSWLDLSFSCFSLNWWINKSVY